MLEFEEDPPRREPADDSPPPRKKRRGCLLVLLVLFFVVFPIGLLILNGPGFRTILRYGGLKAAASQGITGNFLVDGSLWSGFALREIDLSDGTEDGLSLRIDGMSLGYRGWGLLTGATRYDWLDFVHIGKAEIRLKLPEADPERPDKPAKTPSPSSPSAAPTDFNPLWNLLAADLRIDDLTLLIQQGDRVTSVESLRLQITGEENGSLKLTRLSLPGQAPLEQVDARIVKSEHGITIGPLSLFGYADLENLAVSESSPGDYQVAAALGVAGGHLDLDLKAPWQAPVALSLALRRGTSLSLDQIPLPDSKLRGSVTDLALGFSGDPAKPPTWNIDGKVVASKTGWDTAVTDSILLLIRENRLDLEATRGRASVRVEASAALGSATTPADLAKVPVLFAVKAEVPELGATLADFGKELPVSGSLTLDARDFQLSGGKVTTGGLLLETENLAWDRVGIPGARIAAQVERENFVRLAVDLDLDEGNLVHVAGTVDATTKRYEAESTIALDTTGRLGEVLRDLGKETFSGAVGLAWKGSGSLGAEGHTGAAKIDLRTVKIGEGTPIDGQLAASYADKTASLDALSLTAGDVSLRGSGGWDGKLVTLADWKLTRGDRVPLALAASLPLEPGTEGGFLAQTGPLSLDLTLDQLALEEVTRYFAAAPPLPGTLNGSVKAGGNFGDLQLATRLEFQPDPKTQPDKPTTAVEAAASDPAPAPASPPRATVDLALRGDVDVPASWETSLEAVLSGLQFQGMALENISLTAATDRDQAGRPLLARLRFDQSETLLDATARLDLGEARTLADLAAVPLQVESSLEVSKVETLLRDFAPPQQKGLPLAGALSASVQGLKLERGSLTAGTISVSSKNFTVEAEPFDTIDLGITIPRPDELEAALIVALDEVTRIEGKGGFHLKEKRYEGTLAVQADLVAKSSRLRALLGGRPMAELLPGKTSLEWQGHGRLPDQDHTGTLALDADALRLAGGAEPLDLDLAGTYSATSADFPTIRLRSKPLGFDGVLKWADRRLSLVGKGTSEGREVLTLDAGIPLDPAKLKPDLWFGQEAPLSLALAIDRLPVGTISRLAVEKAPILGELSLDLTAAGTPALPTLATTLKLDGITVPREAKAMPAGRLELNLNANEAGLALNGEYRHPDVKPLGIAAKLPFHPADWATGKREVKDETITASAKMDRSSLAFLTGQVPGIESIAGEISLDAEVSGTVAAPQVRGHGELGLQRLRLENRLAPSLQDIELVANFAENRLILDKLSALIAGGTLEGKGEVLLKPGGEPSIQLRLTGSEVLVVRTPDVNVRTDLDLTLAGPFSKAALTGEIGITNSRFFKNFDLLPIGLPSKKAESALPTVERAPSGGGTAYQDLDVGVKIAPFQDWTLGVRLHTKDPFLIRSNLLESSVSADLNLTGTLGRPNPIGAVEIQKGEMSLPFSKIDVETGRVVFDQATGFNGALEFKARGKADRYQISIYLYDRVLSPQYVLTSIPPMPSEDIMTLLATGTTRDELTGGDPGSMAAGKAAGLLLKNLQKKSNEAEGDPTLLDLLEDRTELELGRVNQETGEQTFGGKIRLWKQLFFVGDVDAQSDYRALLKYVFRFE